MPDKRVAARAATEGGPTAGASMVNKRLKAATAGSLVALSLVAAATTAVSPTSSLYNVHRVVDGDTVVVSKAGVLTTVRLLGVNCPESRNSLKCRSDEKHGGPSCEEQIPKGKAVTAIVKQRIEGTVVELEEVAENPDSFGRTLAYIRTKDGADLGLSLIQTGLCENFDKYPHQREPAYKAAQRAAQQDVDAEAPDQ